MFGALFAMVIVAGCATASPSPSTSPGPVPTPSPTPSPSPSPTLEPTPTPIPLDEAMLARRFTVLVAGADTSANRRAGGTTVVNTDALMVVSVSADKSRIDMISVPRDTVDVPLPGGKIYRGKINSIGFKLGITTLRDAMSTLLGVPIDRYVRIDMDDFLWLVDAVGGIDLDVRTHLVDPKVHLNLPAGPTHLDGATALAFSRTRADNDYGRAARQQQVVLALVQRWLDPSAAALLAAAFHVESLQTDISLTELPTLLEIGRRSAAAKVTAVVLQPPRYSLFSGIDPNSARGWVMIPNVAAMRRYAKAALSD
jgi:LCP family protein required for cell wall assembly